MAKHAKRRTKRRTATRRRRRVGAMSLNPSSPLVMIGSVAAGFFLGDKVNGAIDQATGGKVDSKIIAAAEIGLGAMMLLKKGGKKSLIMTALAGVAAGAGIKRGMSAFGIGRVNGYGMVPVIGNRQMLNGYQSVPVIGNRRVGSYNPNSSVLGMGRYGVPATAIMGGIGTTGNGTGSGVNNGSGTASNMMG